MASRELKVEIIGDSRSLERAFGRATKTSGGLGSALTKLGKVAAVGVGAAFVGLGIVVKKGFDELSEGQKVAAQTAARLKSTGDAAHVTAKQVEELATAQSKLTGIDDEAVQAGENMLLTFTNIRNEVGKNNDVFNQATVAVEDMATAMNDGAIPSAEQLSTTAIRVGKALNDPIKGMTALSRVGVAFTAGQKKTIEALVKSGDTMGAQKVILAELTKEFGGSAKAAGKTFPGQLAKLRNAFDDASSKVAVVFLPALTKALGFITDKLIPGISKAADFIGNFWKGISKRLSNAPTLQAKLKVVFTGVENLARQLIDALFSQIQRLLPQKPLVIQPQTKVAVGGGGVDWSKTAEDIVAGLAVALEQSVALAQALGTMVTNAIDKVDWNEGKKLGPGFATMILSAFLALADPGFWVKNWELTLGIAAVVFRVKILEFAAKLVPALRTALIGLVSKVSPEFAAAMGRLLEDAGKVALAVFNKVGGALFRLATAIFGRLTKIAVFVIKVLGITAAISAIKDFVRGAISKLKELLDWLKRLPGRITAALGDLGTLLYDAGVALIQGLWDGVTSKAAGFLSYLGGLASKAKSIFTLGLRGSPELFTYYLGGQMMEDMVKGVKKKEAATAKALYDAAKKALDGAKQAVTDAKGIFVAAFDDLASAALAAFDRVSSEFQTKTEKKISRQDEQRAARDRKQALDDANKALAEANAARARLTQEEGESPEDFARRQQEATQAVIDAVKQRDDALFEIQRAADEKTAAQERKQYEDSRERQRVHFEKQMEALERQLERGQISAREFRRRILALFDNFDIPFRNAGKALGAALASGLHESFADAAAAARRLIEAISAELAKAKFLVSIEVQSSTPKHRQFGGPVKRGSSYWVGEAGPELFIPTSSGRIAPVGGGGTMAEVTVPVYLDGAQITQVVRREMLRFQKRNGTSAV